MRYYRPPCTISSFTPWACCGVGLLSERWPDAWLSAAGWLLFAGVTLFSGSLYLLLAGAPRLLGVLTPIGGAVALIAGWCACAWVLSREHGR